MRRHRGGESNVGTGRQRQHTPMVRPSGGFRRLASAVVVVSLLTGGATTFASESQAGAATCWGDWCSGQDPQATGCANDGVTVAHANIPGTTARVELRWSPSCKTKWARVPSSWGKSYPGNLRVVQRSTGYSQVRVVASNASYSWTRQIYSPTRCVYAAWIGPPGSVGTACW